MGSVRGNQLEVPLLGEDLRQRILRTQPIELWEFSAPKGTSTIYGLVNGWAVTPTDVTFGVPGIGDGRTAAHFNGVSSVINVYSADFVTAFPGAKGWLSIWGKVANAGVWTDGVPRRLFSFTVDSNNWLWITHNGDNNILIYYRAGGVSKYVNISGLSTTDWFNVGMTWGDLNNGNSLKAFWNGVQSGATVTGTGVWAGTPISNRCVIGADNTNASLSFSGFLSCGAMGNRIQLPAEAASIGVL